MQSNLDADFLGKTVTSQAVLDRLGPSHGSIAIVLPTKNANI